MMRNAGVETPKAVMNKMQTQRVLIEMAFAGHKGTACSPSAHQIREPGGRYD